MNNHPLDDEIAALRRVLLRDPADLRSLTALAQALFDAGRHREAIARLRQRVGLRPMDPEAHRDLGMALAQVGSTKEALLSLKRSIAIEPRSAVTRVDLANLLLQGGQGDEAARHYRSAIAFDASWSVPHANLGGLELSRGRAHEAIAHFREALARDVDRAEAASGLGSALLAVGRIDEAVACLRSASLRLPDDVLIGLGLGRALRAAGLVDEAIAVHDALTVAHPDLVMGWDELALDLWEIDDFQRALAAARRSVGIDPLRAVSHIHLGNILADTGRVAEAKQAYRHALKLAPRSALARWNLALTELTLGEFGKGWDDYEARWDCAEFPSPRRHRDRPPLRPGSDLKGKRVLVHAEQGYGDTIQFMRLVPLLTARGAAVVFEIQPALAELALRVDGIGQVVAAGDALPPTDFQVPLLSLPRVLDHHEPEGASVPYLRASSTAETREVSSPMRIGIAWTGSGRFATNRRRLLRLERIVRWFSIANVEWVGLQKEIPAADEALANRLVDRAPRLMAATSFESFTDTADCIAGLDLVISVDTAVAHLAAAMGKPTWILLPFAADFRWLLDRDDSPWYPTVRLFRSRDPHRWDGVIEGIAAELERRP